MAAMIMQGCASDAEARCPLLPVKVRPATGTVRLDLEIFIIIPVLMELQWTEEALNRAKVSAIYDQLVKFPQRLSEIERVNLVAVSHT